ncbi:SH3 domain protein [Bacteriovorax sp. Seq25_V]|uniref:SH3 domain protein n=1 Tax=Bacteriovorax sp. Seq25_V TaxID=1201288 RepID=UPI000389E9C1|nr:SH3 domain protein [Bacteriovorax sp. Seq25_V]EQC43224.1 SH3 domain protein [Bacteriovorax sp. Seq25_V]
MADSNTNKTLKELEQAYLNGKYDKVKDGLITIKNDVDLGQFHYNLGTVLARSNEFGAARYNLEKAKKIGFNYPGLDKNLDSVVKVVSAGSSKTSGNVLDFAVTSSVGLFLFISLVFCLVATLLRKSRVIEKNLYFAIAVLISFLPVIGKVTYIDSKYKVAINIKKTDVYEGPSDIYPVLKEMTEGQKLIIEKSYEDWMLISSPIEYAGWVKRTELGVL